MHELTHAYSYTPDGYLLVRRFALSNKTTLENLTIDSILEEFATAIEYKVSMELKEPEGRRFYNDLMINKEHTVQVRVPGPLFHSNSWGVK